MIARLWLQAYNHSRFYFSKTYKGKLIFSDKPLFSAGKNKAQITPDQEHPNPTDNLRPSQANNQSSTTQNYFQSNMFNQSDSSKQGKQERKRTQSPEQTPSQSPQGKRQGEYDPENIRKSQEQPQPPINEYQMKNKGFQMKNNESQARNNESQGGNNESPKKRRLYGREVDQFEKDESPKENAMNLYGYDGKGKERKNSKKEKEQREQRRAMRMKLVEEYLAQSKKQAPKLLPNIIEPKLSKRAIMNLLQAKLVAVEKVVPHEAKVAQMITNDQIQGLLMDLKKCRENNINPSVPPATLDQLFSAFPTFQSLSLMSNLHSRLQIVNQYLSYYAESNDIPINYPPIWILHVSQYLQKQKHHSKQSVLLLRNIVNLMMTMPNYYHTSIMFTTQTFVSTICNLYFGDQKALPEFLSLTHQAVISTEGEPRVFELFAHEFQMYWIKHHAYPFTMTAQITQLYQASFKEPNIFLALMDALVACYSGYPDVYDHFLKHQEAFQAREIIAVEPICLLLTINRRDHHSSLKKQPLAIKGANYEDVFSKVCVRIKNGQLQQAYNEFLEGALIPQAIPKMRQVVESVMMQYLVQQSNKETKKPQYFFPQIRQKFLDQIDDNFFIDLYTRSLDFAVDNFPYLPEDHFSYWDTICQKERTEQLIKLKAKGLLTSMIQTHPQKYTYNLQEWIEKIPVSLTPYHQDYEVEKQLIKYRNYVKAILIEGPAKENVYLNKLLRQAEIGLSDRAKKILQQFSLYQYNFLTTELMEPIVKSKELRNAVRYTSYSEFIAKFNIMLLYNCKSKRVFTRKEKDSEDKDASKIPWSETFLQEIYFNQRELFENAERICKLTPNPLVDRLVRWGLYNEEPMGIYLGEKLAMITNQHIPPVLAQQVSNFLSYRRILPEGRVELCKKSLQIVGKIDREQIYDVYHDYHHILQRKHYSAYSQRKNSDVYHSAAISYMMKFIPEQRLQQAQPAYYFESAKKGPIRIN